MIYKKDVYHFDKENGKAGCICIVIDADVDIQNHLMQFLRNHKWSGRYANVLFVPYKTNEVFTVKHKISMIKRQNEYADSLSRIIINVTDATTQHTIAGIPISFQEWLFNSTHGNKRVITGVEVAPKKVVRVLFQKNSRYDLEHIIQNIYQEAEIFSDLALHLPCSINMTLKMPSLLM